MDCKKCKEQSALFRECWEVVEAVANERCCVMHLDRADGVKHLLTKTATALIPKLEKYKEAL